MNKGIGSGLLVSKTKFLHAKCDNALVFMVFEEL